MNTNRLKILHMGIVASILAAAACASLVLARVEPQQTQQFQDKVPALPVETLPVRFQTGFKMQRVFSGRVQAQRDSVLGFELGGQLARVLVREGAMVKKGELLAELDTGRLEAQRGELAAALSEAQANLALAEVTLKRLQGVVEAGGISHQGLDESREGQRAARAALELVRRRIATIDVELGKTKLHAPFSGTIIERRADEGRVLGVGESVLRLQENTIPEIRVGVAGLSVNQLRTGDTYRLEWRGTPLAASLRAVLPVRSADARTVDVLFDPLDADGGLRPGDLVTLRLATPIAQPGVWLPVTALAEGERGLWSVYVAEPVADIDAAPGLIATHRVARRTVDVIHQEADRVYVRGAVTQRDQIVMTGLHRIVPGQWVRTFPTPVLRQRDSDGFSEFVSVHGKAQLAGNGCYPCQEVQRSPWALTSSPAGRLRGVPQPRCSTWKGNNHSLRTAPCCETPRRRCTRQYHVDGVLAARGEVNHD